MALTYFCDLDSEVMDCRRLRHTAVVRFPTTAAFIVVLLRYANIYVGYAHNFYRATQLLARSWEL